MTSLVANHSAQTSQLHQNKPVKPVLQESTLSTKNVKREPDIATGSIQLVAGIAYLVIGSLGVAGVLSGTVVGGCAIAFAVPYALSALAQLVKSDNGLQSYSAIFGIITHIAITVLGSLAITGVISPTVLGWCMIGPTLAALPIACCVGCCAFGFLANAVSNDPQGANELFEQFQRRQYE